jgi:predicted nucleotidyltransferase
MFEGTNPNSVFGSVASTVFTRHSSLDVLVNAARRRVVEQLDDENDLAAGYITISSLLPLYSS